MDSIDVLSLMVVECRNKTNHYLMPQINAGDKFIHNNKIMAATASVGGCNRQCYYADEVRDTGSDAHCPILRCAGRFVNPYIIFKEVDHD